MGLEYESLNLPLINPFKKPGTELTSANATNSIVFLYNGSSTYKIHNTLSGTGGTTYYYTFFEFSKY
jgi:hypothetical protein